MFTSILTNPSTLPALHNLGRAQSSLNISIQRLSTGLRINSAKDDPAGLIAATQLKSDIVAVQSKRAADQMDYYKAMVADASYGALSDMVRSGQSLLLQSQGGPSASKSDMETLQSQIDEVLHGIDRLSGSITLDGAHLLGGNIALGVAPDPNDPDADPSSQLALQRIDTSTLGAYTDANDPDHTKYTLADLATGGRLSLTGPAGGSDLSSDQRAKLAANVLTAASSGLATDRASTGAFMRYTVNAFGNVLDDEEEHMTDALSQIQDTDYAAEVSNYVRQQTLINTNTAVMAYGMHQSKQVLSLLSPITGKT